MGEKIPPVMRPITVRKMIQILSEFDLELLVVLPSNDHSFEHRIHVSQKEADFSDGYLAEGYPGDDFNYDVVVIE